MTAHSTSNARRLRGAETDTEHRLWDLLRDRKLAGFKFRRQHPIGRYVLDFYCASARLAIEIDGSDHLEADRVEYDADRTRLLAARAIRVLRFANEEILHEPAGVVDAILRTIRAAGA
jgi:ATP-dependent helicase HrpA/adenine-specific DNA-methyltransferase